MAAEHSRRVVHAGVGLFVASTPLFFNSPDLIYLLAVAFIIVNYVTLRQGWLRGIHGTSRQSLGTVTFPLALVPALLLTWTYDPGRVFAMQVAFLILAIADPLASMVGMQWQQRHGRQGVSSKTWAGSGTFWGVAFIMTGGALAWMRGTAQIPWNVPEVVLVAILVATVTTAVEARGRRGWDNFFIVLAAIVVLVVAEEQPEGRMVFGVATASGVLFGVVSYKVRFLDVRGAIAGGLLATAVIGLGGWAWAVPSFLFFVLSSLLSRVGKQRKRTVEAISEKGHKRDVGQVYANGGVAGILLMFYALFPNEVFFWGFLGAFAAATSDTWGTELGALSRERPRLITTFQKVARGTSGAVSALGTVGVIAGGAMIGLSAWPFRAEPLAGFLLIIAGSGVVGAFVDSLVGATVQARFYDPLTGEETERGGAEGVHYEQVRGWRWLRNDQVNWICTFSGATFAMACFQASNFAS